MSKEEPKELRRGWTTGACATAATKAAYQALLTGDFPDPVEITLPKGGTASFALTRHTLSGKSASAAIIKDAGDDPDVTHGALVSATVNLLPPGSGVVFRAGEGVGTVTRPGLPIPPGEPAINPVPRQMMRTAIDEVSQLNGGAGDVEITVSIEGGAELAVKTMNPRLGILGGLSVLGTTGIVRPFSCAAWIASIHRGIDVARAVGLSHVVGATGASSEDAVKARYDLDETAFLDMGDFAGGLLKYLRSHPVDRLTLAGGLRSSPSWLKGARSAFGPQLRRLRIPAGSSASGERFRGSDRTGRLGQHGQGGAGCSLVAGIDLSGPLARRTKDASARSCAMHRWMWKF